jgi:hypothetical protein
MSLGEGAPSSTTGGHEQSGQLTEEPGAGTVDLPQDLDARNWRRWTRRRVLTCGLGGFIGAAFAGFELVEHGVLPGSRPSPPT